MKNLFCKRFNEEMKQRNITQAEILRSLNFSKNQIHYWLKGKAEPSIDDLISLAKYFGVTVDYLIGYENEDGSIKSN